MHTLTRFGIGSTVYTFDTSAQISYQDNFASLINRTARLPGVSGGISQIGSGRSLKEVGTVRADIWLHFGDAVEWSDKLTSLRQMADWGVLPLYRQPMVGAEQWCWARLTDIQIPMDVRNVPHLRLKAQISFEVSDPHWYRAGTELLWNDGVSTWGGGGNWDRNSAAASPTTITGSGTLSLTNTGNAMTLARLLLLYNTGNPYWVVVNRIVNGEVVDQARWAGTLASGEYIGIDPRRQRCFKGPVGTSQMDTFSAMHPDWMRLEPGTNTLQVQTATSIQVAARWLERST